MNLTRRQVMTAALVLPLTRRHRHRVVLAHTPGQTSQVGRAI